ncbi:hypothetical protein FS764_06830 [Agrobacterium vitis]|uniref:NB-ARC domain-containing protein n=1 Tax=Agrobacterium vitis TaxID=373 RepID=UPI001F1C3AFE|nr:NB-ARC domain-containing protein [Agrobacterium vitis]MCF1466626.1 hypothetical protein [Agrobacterium vitis]
MNLRPIALMNDRVGRSRNDSDTALFHDLLYAGEFVVRLTTAAIVAALDDDLDRHRYRLLHKIVRADGIGEWSSVLDDALNGPASQHLVSAAKEDRRILTERVGAGNWQYDAVKLLFEAQQHIDPKKQPISGKVPLRSWFTSFAELRNKTRGHGAPTAMMCSRVSPLLDESINLICENNPLFLRPLAYLHRNLSGKYRVIPIGGDESVFAALKTASAISKSAYQNGMYISFDSLRRADLLYTDANVSDFFFPNGVFKGRSFELHSLISDNRQDGDASPYLASASELPVSETHGVGQLNVTNNVWSNLPPAPSSYINRPNLENEITRILANDRHPIVTLVGRGGIGKTSLALQILHKISAGTRYEAILWFSARDIDLLPQGPKTVKPQVLTEKDISSEFVNIMGYGAELDPKRTIIDVMSDSLRKSPPSGPLLFVFDNFETMRNPVDVFTWLDSNVRLPNKILITSRFREFKADYPIAIGGMEGPEAHALIRQTAHALGIDSLIDDEYCRRIADESDGHPYVIKIMLGEVADNKKTGRPRQIIARKDDVLDALFDRTFGNLSPLSSRVFLTLSGWRSLVPQLAVEAVLLRDQSEQIDVSSAVDELVRMSLVQRMTAPDSSEFLDVPLTAAIFGSRKLAVSPIKIIIENDIRLLQDLGTSSINSLREGVHPRIISLFAKAASRISDGKQNLVDVQNVLEFVAQSYAPAWLLLADLYEDVHGDEGSMGTAEYVRRYIEQVPDSDASREAWARLAILYRRTNDVIAACGAFLRAFGTTDAPLTEISTMANWVNNNRTIIADLDSSDKRAVFGSMIRLMEMRINEASATDLSRLAWLYLHADDTERANTIAELGLAKEPDNRHCRRLLERLSNGY